MTVGLATTALANKWLDMFRGVAFTAPTGVYVKLHVGDPGSAGTANASAVATRQQATFSAASGGTLTLSNAPAFTMTAAETVSHISVWDNATVGAFLFSAALTTSKTVANTDTLTINSLSVSLSPLAA